jgi:hypothetical protein
MHTLYVFTAYNTQAMYGWGKEADAEAYCAFLNLNREINVFSWQEVTDEEEVALRDRNAEGVNLSDELYEIRNGG